MKANIEEMRAKNVNFDYISLDFGQKVGEAGDAANAGNESKGNDSNSAENPKSETKKEGDSNEPATEGKSQKRGGKGANIKSKKLEKAVQNAESSAKVKVNIIVGKKMQGKRRATTIVKGLQTANLEQKVACKAFKQKFACSSSVISPEEVMIQGDKVEDVIVLLQEKFKISEDDITDVGDYK